MKIGLNILWAPLTTETSRACCHENLIKGLILKLFGSESSSLYAWEDPCTYWDLRVKSLGFQDWQTNSAHWQAPAHLKSSTGEKNRLIIIWQGQRWVATQSSMGQGQQALLPYPHLPAPLSHVWSHKYCHKVYGRCKGTSQPWWRWLWTKLREIQTCVAQISTVVCIQYLCTLTY